MHILIICGSIAQKSHTRSLLRYLETQLTQQDISTTFWDLLKEPLPIAIPEYHWAADRYPNEVVQRFFHEIRYAHGIVLGSPLYHGSFSGVLKNALDLLWYDAFRNKPVALLSHGSSVQRTTQPCIALQPVVKTLYGYSLQTEVATTKLHYTYDEHKTPVLTDADIQERIRRQALELIQLISLLDHQNIIKED